MSDDPRCPACGGPHKGPDTGIGGACDRYFLGNARRRTQENIARLAAADAVGAVTEPTPPTTAEACVFCGRTPGHRSLIECEESTYAGRLGMAWARADRYQGSLDEHVAGGGSPNDLVPLPRRRAALGAVGDQPTPTEIAAKTFEDAANIAVEYSHKVRNLAQLNGETIAPWDPLVDLSEALRLRARAGVLATTEGTDERG